MGGECRASHRIVASVLSAAEEEGQPSAWLRVWVRLVQLRLRSRLRLRLQLRRTLGQQQHRWSQAPSMDLSSGNGKHIEESSLA